MTSILHPTPLDRRKGRLQAEEAAKHIKAMDVVAKPAIKVGFAFNDSLITLHIATTELKDVPLDVLADRIYHAVLNQAWAGSEAAKVINRAKENSR